MKRITFTMMLLTALYAAKAQYFPIDRNYKEIFDNYMDYGKD